MDKDKPPIVTNKSIGAPSDQHVTITEKINPQTGEKTTTYDIKNDAKDKRQWIPWGPWGWGGYQLPNGQWYYPPTSTAPWPSWNFWGPGFNGGTIYRLNELEEELRPDTEEELFFTGLGDLPPEVCDNLARLYKMHRASIETNATI
jgi:hypothetical protein